jgi:hypothetical protein
MWPRNLPALGHTSHVGKMVGGGEALVNWLPSSGRSFTCGPDFGYRGVRGVEE